MVNEQQLLQVIADIFSVPVGEVTTTSTMDDIERWDSIRHMNLVLALEDTFEIEIPDEDAANITSFPLIKLVIEECLANGS